MNLINDDILYRVEKPGRYLGNELNACFKEVNNIDIRFAFAFPDVYEVAMSHLGTKILYHVINKREDTYCERVFAPWPDLENLMRENELPLFSLETKTPLKEFDFIGFTLQYEMSYSNVLNMLNLSNIPLRATERSEDDPIIIGGGPCSYNPEPLYNIFDLFLLGEGEDALNEILELYKSHKGDKKSFLRAVSKVEGVYVPSLYTVDYNEDGTIKEFKPKYEDVKSKVKKRVYFNFDSAPFPDDIIVPYIEIVHDRIVVETMRGCSRGCRFCQAGMIYRPIREKKKDTILKNIKNSVENTGYGEVSLSSLSICDYSNIENLVFEAMRENEKVSIAIPSIRIDSFSVNLIKEIQKVRKTGLTFAPEAGSQRMRDIINKGVNEDDMINSAHDAFSNGWATIKLYFMLGLPYEQLEDVIGIAELSEKVVGEYFKVPKHIRNRGLRVNVSTSLFVPKPFTPFQWAAQDSEEELNKKIFTLKESINSKAINYNYHHSKLSYLEAIFARGDRKLCEVIISAYENGAKFDGWSEFFNFEAWENAFIKNGVNGDFYAYRERCYEEILPWDFIDIGVDKNYLISENEKAKNEVLTVDCREHCTNCGINSSFKEGKCFEGAIRN